MSRPLLGGAALGGAALGGAGQKACPNGQSVQRDLLVAGGSCYDVTMDREELKREIEQAAAERRLSCEEARALAERLDVSYSEVGKACDELNVKVHACQLGCF